MFHSKLVILFFLFSYSFIQLFILSFFHSVIYSFFLSDSYFIIIYCVLFSLAQDYNCGILMKLITYWDKPASLFTIELCIYPVIHSFFHSFFFISFTVTISHSILASSVFLLLWLYLFYFFNHYFPIDFFGFLPYSFSFFLFFCDCDYVFWSTQTVFSGIFWNILWRKNLAPRNVFAIIWHIWLFVGVEAAKTFLKVPCFKCTQ